MVETNLPKKTILVRFPEFPSFFTEAKTYAAHAVPSMRDKATFHFVCYQ
jgi:hypothetical protein